MPETTRRVCLYIDFVFDAMITTVEMWPGTEGGVIGDVHLFYGTTPLCKKDTWPVPQTSVWCTDHKDRVTCQECLEWMHA